MWIAMLIKRNGPAKGVKTGLKICRRYIGVPNQYMKFRGCRDYERRMGDRNNSPFRPANIFADFNRINFASLC
jgi:hypothetical protein